MHHEVQRIVFRIGENPPVDNMHNTQCFIDIKVSKDNFAGPAANLLDYCTDKLSSWNSYWTAGVSLNIPVQFLKEQK